MNCTITVATSELEALQLTMGNKNKGCDRPYLCGVCVSTLGFMASSNGDHLLIIDVSETMDFPENPMRVVIPGDTVKAAVKSLKDNNIHTTEIVLGTAGVHMVAGFKFTDPGLGYPPKVEQYRGVTGGGKTTIHYDVDALVVARKQVRLLTHNPKLKYVPFEVLTRPSLKDCGVFSGVTDCGHKFVIALIQEGEQRWPSFETK